MFRQWHGLVCAITAALLAVGTAQGQGAERPVLDNGMGKYKIDIQGCGVASANVESIHMEDLVIDEREMTTGADWDYRVSGPGDAHFGSITIRSRVPHPREGKNELHQWWLDVSKGKNIRKSITVTAYDERGNAREWNFFECYPTRWDAGDYSPSSNVPPRQGAVVEIVCRYEDFSMASSDDGRTTGNVGLLVVGDDGSVLQDSGYERWSGGGIVTVDESHLKEASFHTTTPGHKYIDTLTLRGPLTPGRKALCTWITETVQGKPWKRMVTVKEILKDGSDGKTFTYLDCFPIRYVFPSFSADGTGNTYEEVHIKPIRLELK